MPSNKAFSHRIQIIDECLRRRQRNWSMEDLLEAVNQRFAEGRGKAVSIRTIYADVKAMILEMYAPIESFKNESKIYNSMRFPNTLLETFLHRNSLWIRLGTPFICRPQVKGFRIADELG